MKITWMTQGGFLFDTGATRILVDPYMSDCLEAKGLKRLVSFPIKLADLRPDILVCTHDHLDHLDPETVTAISAHYPACRLAGGTGCFQHFLKLGIAEQRCVLLQVGCPVSVAPGIGLIPVPAFHSDPHAVGMVFFLPQTATQKIYLTGDTEFNEQLINAHTRKCDMLLVCINGRLGNMNYDQALMLTRRLRPAVALPMHYGLFAENTADPESFILGCREAGIKSWAMEAGREYKFEGNNSGSRFNGSRLVNSLEKSATIEP